MKRGTGSVTAMPGWMAVSGAVSPKRTATGSAQAPAQLRSQVALTVIVRPSLTVKPLPVAAISVASQRSTMRAPAFCAARAKAGDTRRGLACPSSAQNEPAIACSPSHGWARRKAVPALISRCSPCAAASSR